MTAEMKGWKLLKLAGDEKTLKVVDELSKLMHHYNDKITCEACIKILVDNKCLSRPCSDVSEIENEEDTFQPVFNVPSNKPKILVMGMRPPLSQPDKTSTVMSRDFTRCQHLGLEYDVYSLDIHRDVTICSSSRHIMQSYASPQCILDIKEKWENIKFDKICIDFVQSPGAWLQERVRDFISNFLPNVADILSENGEIFFPLCISNKRLTDEQFHAVSIGSLVLVEVDCDANPLYFATTELSPQYVVNDLQGFYCFRRKNLQSEIDDSVMEKIQSLIPTTSDSYFSNRVATKTRTGRVRAASATVIGDSNDTLRYSGIPQLCEGLENTPFSSHMGGICEFLKLWEPTDVLTTLQMSKNCYHGANYTGEFNRCHPDTYGGTHSCSRKSTQTLFQEADIKPKDNVHIIGCGHPLESLYYAGKACYFTMYRHSLSFNSSWVSCSFDGPPLRDNATV